MMIPPSLTCRQMTFLRRQKHRHGFSILELLVVIGVITVMLGLVLGSTGAINGTQGMTAIHQVTAMCDLARARAMRGEGTILLAFAAANGGATGEPYSSAILCAEDESTENPNDYKAISEWYHLPKGYVFTTASAVSPTAGLNILTAPNATRLVALPGNGPQVDLPCVGFGSLGEVIFPEPDATAQDSLLIAVAEGQATEGGPLSRTGSMHRPDQCRWVAVRRNSGAPMILP